MKAMHGQVAKITALEPEMEKLSDAELRAKTDEFRAAIADGASVDDLVTESFAVVREVGRRILGKPADDVDLRRMLALLSGRRHHCLSAVAVIDTAGTLRHRLSDTIVAFRPLDAAEIEWLDAYHRTVRERLSPRLEGDALAWLERRTRPLV